MPPVVSHLQFHQRRRPGERLPGFFSDGSAVGWLAARYEQGWDFEAAGQCHRILFRAGQRCVGSPVPAMWSSAPLHRLRP